MQWNEKVEIIAEKGAFGRVRGVVRGQLKRESGMECAFFSYSSRRFVLFLHQLPDQRREDELHCQIKLAAFDDDGIGA